MTTLLPERSEVREYLFINRLLHDYDRRFVPIRRREINHRVAYGRDREFGNSKIHFLLN